MKGMGGMFRVMGAMMASTALRFGLAPSPLLITRISSPSREFGRIRSRSRVPTKRRPIPWDETQTKIQRMTNWQRTQWARAGYKPSRVAEFLAMERHNAGR